MDKHDEEDHQEQDYNDYRYVDSLRKCKDIDWVALGKVGKVKD